MSITSLTLAVFVRNGGACLQPFLRSLEAQTYPKSSTILYIRSDDNIDGSDEVLLDWIDRNKNLYMEVDTTCSARVDTNDSKGANHDWTPARFERMAKLRQASVDFARTRGTHYFTVDVDCFISPRCIEDLLESGKPVIGPLLALSHSNPHASYANFHHAVNSLGYFEQDEAYMPIRNCHEPGIHEVAVIHCSYLIRNEILSHVNYADGTDRHEYVIFSDGLRKSGIPQFIDNRDMGFLTWATTRAEIEKDEVLMQYLLRRGYIHPYLRWIVTTTINPPGDVLRKYASFNDWKLCVVGDKKTPHLLYRQLETAFPNVLYLSPDYQEQMYPELSAAIGWNSIQRRNCGFVEAYRKEARVIASIDDDNMPYDHWGKNVAVDRLLWCPTYEPITGPVFDPMSVTAYRHFWHRGFPLELVPHKNKVTPPRWRLVQCHVQADPCNGHPDIDALCRIAHDDPIVGQTDHHSGCYSTTALTPFNSQTTFLSREVIPYYACLPFVGRLDDIWGAYLLQHWRQDLQPFIVYGPKASVYQDRTGHAFDGHEHGNVDDLKREFIGYANTWNLIQSLDKASELLGTIDARIPSFMTMYRNLFQPAHTPRPIRTSVVIVSRNDNYGGNLLERARYCLEAMCRTMDEVIYVDWNSPGDVSLTEALGSELPSNLVLIKIGPALAIAALAGRQAQPCCEVLGRNVGIRAARGQVIISSNIDIIPPTRDALRAFLDLTWNKQALYCTRRRNIDLASVRREVRSVETIQIDLEGKHTSQAGYWPDGISIVEGCGDFQLAHRDLWWELRGFNEQMVGRYFADSELQWRAQCKGHPVLEHDFPVYHLDHDRSPTVANDRHFQALDPNDENWGLLFDQFPSLV